MKHLLLIIFSMFLSNPSATIDHDEIVNLLNKQIQNKPTIGTGLSEIKNLLGKDNEKFISWVDKERLQNEFKEWLTKTLIDNPLPANVKSICFGLFTMSDNNEEITTIYLSGSSKTPLDNPKDWNVEPLYFPTYYFVSTDFSEIDKTYPKLTGAQETLIFNGILNLIVINSVEDFQGAILKHSDSIYVGTGFDAGDTYILGILTSEGLKGN